MKLLYKLAADMHKALTIQELNLANMFDTHYWSYTPH